MVYQYKVRYFIAALLRQLQQKLFYWQIKLENKNYWNEYNENFRA